MGKNAKKASTKNLAKQKSVKDLSVKGTEAIKGGRKLNQTDYIKLTMDRVIVTG